MVTADDLTGAQEMGALPASKRLRTLVKTALQTSGNYDAVVIDTESRNLQPDEAARRVRAAASSIPRIEPSVQMFKKKVDSTLRGPIGAELLALSAALGGARDRVDACLSPAWPVTDSCVRNLLGNEAGSQLIRVCDAESDQDLQSIVMGALPGIILAGSGGLGRAWVDSLPAGIGRHWSCRARKLRFSCVAAVIRSRSTKLYRHRSSESRL